MWEIWTYSHLHEINQLIKYHLYNKGWRQLKFKTLCFMPWLYTLINHYSSIFKCYLPTCIIICLCLLSSISPLLYDLYQSVMSINMTMIFHLYQLRFSHQTYFQFPVSLGPWYLIVFISKIYSLFFSISTIPLSNCLFIL